MSAQTGQKQRRRAASPQTQNELFAWGTSRFFRMRAPQACFKSAIDVLETNTPEARIPKSSSARILSESEPPAVAGGWREVLNGHHDKDQPPATAGGSDLATHEMIKHMQRPYVPQKLNPHACRLKVQSASAPL